MDSGICTGQFKHHYGGSTRRFISLWMYIYIYEMDPSMSEKQVKEYQYCVATPIFDQAGVEA